AQTFHLRRVQVSLYPTLFRSVLVRGVVRHHIDRQPDTALVQLIDQALERAGVREGGIDAAEVADVIAVIMAGGGEERGDPDSVHTKRLDVVQALDDALQVTRAVAIGVGEGADVDLVDDRVRPPGRPRGSAFGWAGGGCVVVAHVLSGGRR